MLITNFYEFIKICPQALKPIIEEICQKLELKGTVLLAEEGINATLSGREESIQELYQYFKENVVCVRNQKEMSIQEHAFKRLKIKIKKEIITMKVDGLNINKRGRYVTSDEWDSIIDDPHTIVIDTRNDYEVSLGTFRNAINPSIRNFHEFPSWFDRNAKEFIGQRIAMFCTGGIRCEKTTAFIKMKGFDDVVHLEGGILKYLIDRKENKNNWNGQCFVFDERLRV